MKKNILVLPCGSEIGLEIHRSLNFSTHVTLYGGSSVDDHGKFVYKNYIGGLPYVSEPDFIQKVNGVIEKYDIDFVFPAHDDVVLALAQAHKHGKLKCKVITSPLETCELARSKAHAYKTLKEVVHVPKMYNSSSEVETSNLPVFLKPDVGQGSKGTHLARSFEDVTLFTKMDPSLLILEYLPGDEYTVDCFTDKNGHLQYCAGRDRSRIQNGISVHSKPVNNDQFVDIAEKLNSNLVFRGVWFFQLKKDKSGDLVLLEFAPRVAGTMGLERARGVNLPLLSLFDALDMTVDILNCTYEVEVDRALYSAYKHNILYQNVYIDLDDLIINLGKVNPYVIAFIYQCHNNDKGVYLITRHRQVLSDTLKKYHLNSVFDEVIQVKDDEEKSIYITKKDAIFIDDSFTERKKVAERCKIPTFDAHMLESLMERF